MSEAGQVALAHQEFCPPQAPLVLIRANQVHQTSRSSYNDMWSFPQLDSLMHHVHTADDNGRVQIDGRSNHAKLLRNLKCEFAVRGKIYMNPENGTECCAASAGSSPSWSEHDSEQTVRILGQSLQDG